MEHERKEDRSIYYWLVDLFEDSPFIEIVDENTDSDLVIPSIALSVGPINARGIQLGDRRQYNMRVWYIDIYAINKDQRSDIAYKIFRALDNGIPVYDYDEGFPPEFDPTQIDTIVIDEKKYKPVDIVPELVEKMYWRGSITILSEVSLL